jgi:YD repeat-containing protein
MPAKPSRSVTTNTYDADGRLLQVQQSVAGTGLRTTQTSYTLTGKAATATDANGNVTRYAYDLDDRLTSATDPVGRVTTFGYPRAARRAHARRPRRRRERRPHPLGRGTVLSDAHRRGAARGVSGVLKSAIPSIETSSRNGCAELGDYDLACGFVTNFEVT